MNTKSRFYSQILKLVIPIIVQNLLSAAVNSADVVMLNYVGQSSISAVSLASNYASVLFMVFYGLGTGATILRAEGTAGGWPGGASGGTGGDTV